MSEPTAQDLVGVLCRTDLTPSARLAWQWLLVETRAGRPWPSFTQLAVVLGLSERRVRELLVELAEAGEISYDDARHGYVFPAVDGVKLPA